LSAFSRGATDVDSGRPPYALVLGVGVVLLAAAFVARGYVRRRSLA
jgi:MYXO-CTERM domain-containing protein